MIILQSTAILRYGAYQDGEKEEISRYYSNCNRLNLKPIVEFNEQKRKWTN